MFARNCGLRVVANNKNFTKEFMQRKNSIKTVNSII